MINGVEIHRVALVGAGPGDPGLLTRRGVELLARAQVVIYDQLANARLLALAPAEAERIDVGKRAGRCATPQETINELIVKHAIIGRRVVRLKGGDPYVFGRGAEEAEYLRARGIPFEVVPGVTAALGASAYAGIPLTHRDFASAVAFVTGHGEMAEKRLDWANLARFPGTLVVYMGVRRLHEHVNALLGNGKDATTSAAIVERGTLAGGRVIVGDLASIADRAVQANVKAPALLIVGEVVARRSVLDWFEESPLAGLRIVVTRPSAEFESAARSLEALGAEAIAAPTVVVEPPDDFSQVDAAIQSMNSYDWIVFTSANGVRHFLDRVLRLGFDARVLGGVRIAAIGPSTAEALARYSLKADLIPHKFRSEELAGELAEIALGKRVLLARADRGRTLLKDELDAIAHVDQIAVYKNRDAISLDPAVIERIDEGTIDWVILTSSAIARRFLELLPESTRVRMKENVRIATISPVTSAAVRELGCEVDLEASTYTWEGIVQALTRVSKPAR
jgi:uroporphyrinogen III methyltransferase/synthase